MHQARISLAFVFPLAVREAWKDRPFAHRIPRRRAEKKACKICKLHNVFFFFLIFLCNYDILGVREAMGVLMLFAYSRPNINTKGVIKL